MKTCPECGSHELLVYAKTAYKLNTEEFFCHSVKSHDENAECRCMDCDWHGMRGDLFVASSEAKEQS